MIDINTIHILKEYVHNEYLNNCPQSLHYHCWKHVIEVTSAAEMYAKMAGLNVNDSSALLIAALFHDIGMHKNLYYLHEIHSAEIAHNILSNFNFDNEDIKLITSLILSTDINKPCQNYLESIIRDCDIDYVGTDKYFERSKDLRKEWEILEIATFKDEPWYRIQLLYLNDTNLFKTEMARDFRNEGLKKNIDFLQTLVRRP